MLFGSRVLCYLAQLKFCRCIETRAQTSDGSSVGKPYDYPKMAPYAIDAAYIERASIACDIVQH